MKNEDLVTGTPVKSVQDIVVYYNKYIEIFKIIQRVIMVILTIAVVVSLNIASSEIKALRIETARIAMVAEQAMIKTEKAINIAEGTRKEINQQIDEIQKDGIKLHFRLW